MTEKRVLVVGCGVTGACSAYYLSQAGWQVSMVDQGNYADGCSHGNCGLLTPSHALPLAMPGVIRKTMPTLFSGRAPVHVKPRLDPALWSWLLHFARRCRREPMLQSAQGRHTLLQSSFRLTRELIEQEALHCEFEHLGCLFVFRDRHLMDAYAQTDQLLADFGLAARRLDGAALCQREPALQSGLAGAWYYEMDAHLRPDRLMSELRRVLQARGVEIHEHTQLQGLVKQGQQVVAARTSRGDMPADHFLIATGAWTPLLNRWLGARIPIQPGKGYSMTMPRPEICPKIPMLLQEVKVAVTPLQSAYRLGSTMEFAGYDTSLNRARLQALKNGAAQYLRQPSCDPVEEEWYGWRPMTYDGQPIIDRCGGLANLHVAAGHNMLGLSMGAATGKLVAELISGQQPHIDPHPYRLARFG
jgi:D-amino-acid dehydrogenase